MTSLAALLSIVVTRTFLALVTPTNLVWGLYIPGYDERSVLHVCSGQIKDLACEINEFMWVHSVIIGYSPTDPSGCKISATDDCQANLIDHDYWRATSYQRYSLVTVPARTVTCGDFTVQHNANYVIITYSCVSEASLQSMDICQSASRTMVEGHLTNPRWALGVGRQTFDCTCLIEPTIGSTLSATLVLLYTDLPERIRCGEEASVEDQDGNILLHHCSPGWLQLITSPAPKVFVNTTTGTRYVRVHFIKEHTNDFPPRMTKLWYGFEVTMFGAGCGTIVLVIIIIVLACVLVRIKRPIGTPASPVSPAVVWYTPDQTQSASPHEYTS